MLKNYNKDLFERFGKEVEVGFYTVEELDNNDPSYMQKLTDSGFVGDDGKIWVNKTIIDSGKPLELNSVFAHEGVHVVKGSGSELLAEFGESRGRDFIQEAIKNGSIKVETVGVSDWGNNTLTAEEREKLGNVQGLQDRIYLDTSLTLTQRERILEELQKNTNYELKIKESGTGINKKYEIVINKDGKEYKKTQNLENDLEDGNKQIINITENEFDNLIAQHNNSLNQVGDYKFQLSGLQQFNEGGNRGISLDNYKLYKEIDEKGTEYNRLENKKNTVGLTVEEQAKQNGLKNEIDLATNKINTNAGKDGNKASVLIIVDFNSGLNVINNSKSLVMTPKDNPNGINTYNDEKTKSKTESRADNIGIGHEIGHAENFNSGEVAKGYGDHFYYDSNGIRRYEASKNGIQEEPPQLLNANQQNLVTINLKNELKNGIYVKDSDFLNNNTLKNDLEKVLGSG